MTWITWLPRILIFVLWFAKEIVLSNAAVTHADLTGGKLLTEGVTVLPTNCRTEFEIMLLGTLVTLTPGSMAMGATASYGQDNRRALYVYGMYWEHPHQLRAHMGHLEKRLLGAIRRKGYRP